MTLEDKLRRFNPKSNGIVIKLIKSTFDLYNYYVNWSGIEGEKLKFEEGGSHPQIMESRHNYVVLQLLFCG